MLRKLSITALVVLPVIVQASPNNTVPSNSWLPIHGRALVSAGVTDIGLFDSDLMQPIYGKQDSFLYADFMADYGTNDTYLISPGAGYRSVYHNQIMGAYLFGDYQKVSLGENFWVINPGIEWMNVRWDAHLNGYFPTTESKQNGTGVFASDLGDYSGVSFEEGTHNQYDNLLVPYDVIGNGVDAEVGFSFSSFHNFRSRLYLGGYYYQPPADASVDDITGVTAGYEQPFTKNLVLSIFNSYDEVNNYLVGVSLTATFDQESTIFSNNIRDRLWDPNERHVGIIGTGAGTYDQQATESIGPTLQYDNVYFMSPNASANATGTYGDPMLLTQSSLDTINANNPNSSRIYLQGGANSVYSVDATTATETDLFDSKKGLYIYNGQDFYGRSDNYMAPASNEQLPTISVDSENNYNGFIMQGGENTFSNLLITSSSSSFSGPYNTSGIVAYGEAGQDSILNIENTTISGGAFVQGVLAQNESSGNLTLNIEGSSLSNNGVVSGSITLTDPASGLVAINSSSGVLNINALNSSFDDNGILSDSATADGGLGLYARSSGSGAVNVSLINSSLNGNGVINDAAQMEFGSAGLYAINEDTASLDIQIENSTFNNNVAFAGSASMHSISSSGATILNDSSGDTIVQISNSEFNGNSELSGSSNLSDSNFGGLYIENNNGGGMALEITNSQFNNNGNVTGSGSINPVHGSNSIAGLVVFNDVEGYSNIVVEDSQFNGNGVMEGSGSISDSDISGMSVTAVGSTIDLSAINSTFNGNGVVTGAGTIHTLVPSSGLSLISLGDTYSSVLNVTDLSGSSFNNNGKYGLLASAEGLTGTTGTININPTGATFTDNGVSRFELFEGTNGVINLE